MNNIKSANVIFDDLADMTGRQVPPHFENAIRRWIYKALRLVKVPKLLTTTNYRIRIQHHVGKLPCYYHEVVAVINMEDGRRMRAGLDGTHLPGQDSRFHSPIEADQDLGIVPPMEIDFERTRRSGAIILDPIGARRIDDVNFANRRFLNTVTEDYYKLVPGQIQTSFEEGDIILTLKHFPSDKSGYPLIPDIMEIREAIVWYIIRMLNANGHQFQTGYFNNYSFVDKQWDEKRAEAIDAATYITVDEFQSAHRATTRLIPDETAWQEFFINSEYPEVVDTHGIEWEWYEY